LSEDLILLKNSIWAARNRVEQMALVKGKTMLSAFLVILREGLEIALIIGIIVSYMLQRGQARALGSIWAGMAAAAVVSVGLAAALLATGAEFPEFEQEIFEVIVALVAVAVLVSMVFWMRKAGRTMRAELHGRIDEALLGDAKVWSLPLAGMAFLIVGREGVEITMFLVAMAQQSSGASILAGAALGMVVSAALGVLVVRFGARLNLGKFFKVTGVFVIFVAAGLLASVLHPLHEAGFWNLLQEQPIDLSQVLPVDGAIGVVLASLFGYSDQPTLGQLLLYFGFLIPTLLLFLAKPKAALVRA
jgi:high-affinity iron transporter